MEQLNKLIPIITICVVGVMLYAILNKFGLINFGLSQRGRDLKKIESEENRIKLNEVTAYSDLLEAPFFDPKYWKDKSKSSLTSESFSIMKAKDIHNAIGFWYDDVDKINGVFRSLDNKVQVSQVADAYYTTYNEDLITDILNNLRDGSERAVLLSIINSLPDA